MNDVLIARIGKPHGLKGEVTVRLHTDAPDERFAVGATFQTEPAANGPLTLRTHRVHNGIHLLSFDEAADRTAAEGCAAPSCWVPHRTAMPARTPGMPRTSSG
ncbi:hypothetical protein [Flexivirga alba]|uniref:RimM N-terminal domain-containing protein n=1 Tax=Flexivirga alba TaxID=702742 RepID=A0ABW2AHL0_9MICO